MAELNFVVDQAALDTIKNTQLSANFAEMKEALTEFIEPYTQLIVNEDAIAEAKADRAKINAVAKHVDDYRKLVKKIYTEPLKQFEDQCRELVMICDQGKNNIDYQLAEFEERRKEEKFVLLKAHFEAARMSMDNPEYITSSLALHPKWENKTTSLEECQRYMDEAIQKVDTEVKTIRNLHSQWETSLLDDYSKNHDLLSVLALNERLTEKAQQEAERKRKEQEERDRRQAELEAQKEATKEAEQRVALEDIPPLTGLAELANDWDTELKKAISEDQKKATYVGTFVIHGTKRVLGNVMHLLDEAGITYLFKCEELL